MHQYTADLANRYPQSQLITTTSYPADRYANHVQIHTPVTHINTGLSWRTFNLPAFFQLTQTLLRLNPTLLHITGPHLWNIPILYWCKHHRIPTLHTLHDLDPHHGRRFGQYLHYWNNQVIKHADHILVHGKIYQKRLQQQRDPSTVHYTPLLHLFLSAKNTPPPPPQPSINNKLPPSPFILFFARLETYKGIDTLLKAWEVVVQAGFTQFKLVIAGKGTLPNNPSTNQIKRSDNIQLINHHINDDLALSLFSHCSLVILPYRDGTQSAIIPAAYYFKKPVIATRVGALPEYVIEGKTGFVIPPNDIHALAQIIIKALSNLQTLTEMGLAGRTWYNQQRQQEEENLTKLYQSIARN
jgi:glycosyltransferase involved in cell wall biosynthesis